MSHSLDLTPADKVAAHNLMYVMSTAQIHCDDAFVKLLTKLLPTQTVGSDLLAGLIDAPAGKRYHHPERHGLLAHLADMLRMWESLSKTPGTTFNALRNKMIDADHYMVTGILMHDLHKAHQFYTMTTLPAVAGVEEPVYAFDYYKPKGICLDNDQRSLSLMLLAGVPIDELLLQMVFNAEGGYAKHRAANVHVLSKALYLLDELSVLNWRAANDKLITQP